MARSTIAETFRRFFTRNTADPVGDQSDMSRMRDDPNFVFPGGDAGPLTSPDGAPEGGDSTRAAGSVASKTPLPRSRDAA